MTVLNVAVVGVGAMGQHHARVYSSLKNVNLVAVVDTNRGAAEAVARQNGCEALTDFRELPGRVQAVSVAVPAVSHAEVGTYLLERGIHCLMEKPLADSEAAALALIAAAKRSNALLTVGHIERFNPAIDTLFRILPPDAVIRSVESRRMSWVQDRGGDVDVLTDLMVHDIDIVLALLKSPITNVTASGFSRQGSLADHVTALCSCANGATVVLNASKAYHAKVRELSILTDKGLYLVDYSRQELQTYRAGNTTDFTAADHYAVDTMLERVFVRNMEPLMMEIKHFVGAVLNGTPLQVTAEHALEALRLVWLIQDKLNMARGA